MEQVISEICSIIREYADRVKDLPASHAYIVDDVMKHADLDARIQKVAGYNPETDEGIDAYNDLYWLVCEAATCQAYMTKG